MMACMLNCVIQQTLLEASAENLAANIVTNGTETWNGNEAQTLRSILNMTSDVVFMHTIPVENSTPEIL